MDASDVTSCKRALATLPDPAGAGAAASRFMALLIQYLPAGTSGKAGVKFPVQSVPISSQYDPANQILTVQQINIGNKLRIRALPIGGVLEVLGLDGVWHSFETFK